MGNQEVIQYHSDNGVNLRQLLEHVYGWPSACSRTSLSQQEKAEQYAMCLQAPALAIYNCVLLEQLQAQVTDLDDILKAYVDARLGVAGQRAAYRQLEGLKAVRKPRHMLCFEWQENYLIGNNMVQWLPGPEDKMNDETLRRAYLDTFPTKWVSDFEKVKTSDMSTTTVEDINAFMTELEEAAAIAQAENEAKQQENAKKRRAEGSSGYGNKKSRRNNPGKYTKKGASGGSTFSGPPKDDEQCRLHPTSKHTWKECYMHPKNANKSKSFKGKGKAGPKTTGEDNHMMDEDAMEVDEAPKAPTGKNQVAFALPTTITLPDDTHHLDCFALHHVESNVQPLTPSLAMSKTTTSALPCSSSWKRPLEQCSSFSPRDSLEERSKQKEALESTAVVQLTNELFSIEPLAENYIHGSSDNTVIGNPNEDAIPMTVLVAFKVNGVISKIPLKVLLDSGSTSNFIYPHCLPKACKPTQLASKLDVTLLKGTASVNEQVDCRMLY